jgi:hypothetical protein
MDQLVRTMKNPAYPSISLEIDRFSDTPQEEVIIERIKKEIEKYNLTDEHLEMMKQNCFSKARDERVKANLEYIFDNLK